MSQLSTYLSKQIQFMLLMFVCMAVSVTSASAEIHNSFDNILQENVKDGKVNYPGISNNEEYFSYLNELEQVQTFANKDQELAFWINAYNALAIKGILDDLSPKTLLGRLKYFKKVKYKVGGKEINLYDLERDVIIPFGEPRIHFAINCASVSCPPLLSEAYSDEKLEQQLEQAALNFLNDASRNQFDREKKIARVSKIFKWFKEDFSNHSGSVQKYIAQYVADPELAEQLRNEEYKIKYLKYDWNLNGTPPSKD